MFVPGDGHIPGAVNDHIVAIVAVVAVVAVVVAVAIVAVAVAVSVVFGIKDVVGLGDLRTLVLLGKGKAAGRR